MTLCQVHIVLLFLFARFELLLTEENSVEHEIEIIQSRIQNMSAASGEPGAVRPHSARRPISQSSTLPPEVKAFEVKLSRSVSATAHLFGFEAKI